MPAGGRLGGHIVQGHVDGVATLLSRTPGERSDELRFSLPAELARFVVEKGSIAVDGVSLTVAARAPGRVRRGADPDDLGATPRSVSAQPGDTVNLEVDVSPSTWSGSPAGIWVRVPVGADEEAQAQ